VVTASDTRPQSPAAFTAGRVLRTAKIAARTTMASRLGVTDTQGLLAAA